MQVLLTTCRQLGQALLSRRKGLKITQEEAGRQLGISQKRFSELELNPERITLDRLLVLANTLGLELVLREKSAPSSSEW